MPVARDPVDDGAGSVRVRVPAKINLHLSVGPARADGFHELVTVFQAVTLADEVVARPAPALALTLTGEGADQLPRDSGNLAWRAAELLARYEQLDPAVRLDVDKRIPVAGGMAGGSADAAAALVACATLWRTGTSRTALTQLAAELGSDVAFPLLGGTALGTGRGERLTAVPVTGEFHWALALSDGGIAAGEAYRELDRLRGAGAAGDPLGAPDAVLAALRAGDVEGLARALGNDLQAAALSLRPSLRDVLDTGRRLGALAGMVSGSGPTCAFLCPDAAAATVLADGLTAAGVCRAARVVASPAPGAHVVERHQV